MKKAVLFALIALLGGLALGTLFGSGISSASLNSVRATAAEYPAAEQGAQCKPAQKRDQGK